MGTIEHLFLADVREESRQCSKGTVRDLFFKGGVDRFYMRRYEGKKEKGL